MVKLEREIPPMKEPPEILAILVEIICPCIQDRNLMKLEIPVILVKKLEMTKKDDDCDMNCGEDVKSIKLQKRRFVTEFRKKNCKLGIDVKKPDWRVNKEELTHTRKKPLGILFGVLFFITRVCKRIFGLFKKYSELLFQVELLMVKEIREKLFVSTYKRLKLFEFSIVTF